MIRRVVFALTAVAAAALAVLAPGVPAFAAPKPLCTTTEWQNPANFVDCTNRLKEAAAARATCLKAPTPASPADGLAGWVSNRPESNMRSGMDGRWSTYGVGGYRLDLFDVGCAGTVRNPQASAENMLAGWLFTAAAGVIGASNSLRELAYRPGSLWTWMDDGLADLTTKLHEQVWLPLSILALAGVGMWLLWRARHGQMSEAARTVGWAVAVMVVVTVVAKYPLHSTRVADTVSAGGLGLMHGVVGPSSATRPADQCPLPDPDACVDHRTAATRASDVVVESVLYRAWLRAALGDDDSVTAKTYGPVLFDAATLTWAEAANIEAHPELRPVIIAQKADRWLTVSEQIKVEDPAAYEHLQGVRGSDRWAAGLIALLSALIFAVFDMTWSLLILLGFGIFRLAVLAVPIVGTIGIIRGWSGPLRKLLNSVVASVINIVLFGAAAGLFLTVVERVFASSLPGLAQTTAVLLAGVICWLLLSPVQRGVRSLGFKRLERDSADGEGRQWLRGAAGVLGRLAKDAAVQATSDRGASGPVRAEAWVGRPRPETRALTAGPKGGAR